MKVEDARGLAEGTKVTYRGKVRDFGFVCSSGVLVLHEEGERDLKDSFGVDPSRVELAEAEEPGVVVPLEDRPELPPGWVWHPENGKPNVMIKWRAFGPKVGSLRLEAHAKLKPDDTPEGCAGAAWRQWERLSGLKKDDVGKIKAADDLERLESQCVEMIGGGEVICHLCKSVYEGEEREGDEKGPWHAPHCFMYRREFPS